MDERFSVRSRRDTGKDIDIGTGIDTAGTDSIVTWNDSRPETSSSEVCVFIIADWSIISPVCPCAVVPGSELGVRLDEVSELEDGDVDSPPSANVRLFSSLLRSLANRRLSAFACCFVCPCAYAGSCPCECFSASHCSFLGCHFCLNGFVGNVVGNEFGVWRWDGKRELEVELEVEVETQVEGERDRRVGRGL